MPTSPAPQKKGDLSSTPPSTRLARSPGVRRTIAITGAASLLGKNLVGLLEEDDRVSRIVSIDVHTPTTAGAKSRAYEVDLTQATAEERVGEILSAERVDTLVHLGAWRNRCAHPRLRHDLLAAEAAAVQVELAEGEEISAA